MDKDLWAAKQPDDNSGEEDCVLLKTAENWLAVDDDCEVETGALVVCEYKTK